MAQWDDLRETNVHRIYASFGGDVSRIRTPDAINMISHFRVVVVGLLVMTISAKAASAQSFDLVGTRALGMGGAFVAVADDASATWWNPAGLPNSLIVDGIAEGSTGRLRNSGDPPISDRTGSEWTSGGVAFALPVLAASYFRTRESRLEPAIAGALQGRENDGTARVGRSLLLHQFGLSLAHSLGDAVVVGATVRVIRGTLSTLNPAEGDPDAVFGALGDIDGASKTEADVDVGVLVRASRLRVGLATRNLTTPSFRASDGATWALERQARLGMAIMSMPAAPDARIGWWRSIPICGAKTRRSANGATSPPAASAGSRRGASACAAASAPARRAMPGRRCPAAQAWRSLLGSGSRPA